MKTMATSRSLTKQRVSYLYLVFLKSELRPTSVLSPFPIAIHCRRRELSLVPPESGRAADCTAQH